MKRPDKKDFREESIYPELKIEHTKEYSIAQDVYINHLESKLQKEMEETKIITVNDELVGSIEVVECCKVGPIVHEKYCPMCGRRISNPKQKR